MPRAGIPLFTTRYKESFRMGQRILRRKDQRYYIVCGIHEVVEDGTRVYTIYGYVDSYQGHEQEDDD